jgi:tRNA-modifying protein YgfZ
VTGPKPGHLMTMTATRLASRAVVRLSPKEPGEDVAAFLQGLVTNDVTGTLPVYAGLLTPQGKTLFDFLVWEGDNDLLLDCEAEAAEDLVRRLSLYRLRRKIAIAVDPSIVVHWSPAAREGAKLDPRLPELGWRWLARGCPPTEQLTSPGSPIVCGLA